MKDKDIEEPEVTDMSGEIVPECCMQDAQEVCEEPSEIEVLSNEEMTKLFVEYQNGNLDAKDRLINGNLKLVLSILRTFNKGILYLTVHNQICISLAITDIGIGQSMIFLRKNLKTLA